MSRNFSYQLLLVVLMLTSFSITYAGGGGGGGAPILGDGSWNNCGPDSYYDTGDVGADYNNSETITETYCSDNMPTTCIEFVFTLFNTESCCDNLSIYDGPSTASPLIGTYAGTALPNGGTIGSSTGCLTFEWTSDGSVVNPGWEASFSCVPCPTCVDGIQNGSETGVDCGGSMCTPCPCENQTIATLPFSQAGMTTCGFGDTYSSADACGSSYMNGDDYVFEYTSPGNECLNIVLSNTDATADVGVFLIDNCPDAVGANCMGSATVANGPPTLGAAITTAGTYYIVVSTWPSPQCTAFDINITSSATPTGTTCANPTVIAGLPYTQAGLTTSCMGDDYSSLDACGSSYMNGDDYVFEYTATGTECLNISITNTGPTADVGVFLLDGCPDAGATCLGSSTQFNGGPTLGATVPGAGTYYIVVSTSPSPQSTNFDININSTAAGAPGTDCANPFVLATLPFSQLGMTTSCYGDDYSSADACGSSYMNGDDFIFQYTPAANETVDITLANTTSTGIFIFDGCPSSPPTNCVASATGTNPSLSCISLTGGTTYYFMVSTWPSPQSTTFDISITRGLTPPACGLNYTISTIAHNPINYNTGTSVTFSDDRFANANSPIGFSFCFDGVPYTEVLISSNGYVVFPGCLTTVPGGSGTTGGYSPYDIDLAVPNTTDAPTNAIMLTWHDINPGIGGAIRYQTTGTTPNQIFIVKFDDIPMYQSSCDGIAALNFSGQLFLYETTNVIEFHIDNKEVCSTWPTDVPETAIMGLHNFDGTIAVVPGGYNYPTSWTASNEAWRFTPSCGACAVLPIELTSFNGQNKGAYNILNWQTATEINNDFFTIEKSKNARDWGVATKIKGAGNSNVLLDYDWTDNAPFSKITYYRLKQTDFDGRFEYSQIIAINSEMSEVFEISDLFPNPAEDYFNFTYKGVEDKTLLIQIYNHIGILVLEKTINDLQNNSQQTIKTDDLAKGIYFVKFLQEGKQKTSKLIISS
ncbi:MAG: hypothetical protein COA97_09290 [Flavobacteriales bacterium]|nr:MAG: hypothetical protein COA97_09290 [Flavobacteriales bacterium]